MGKFWQRNYYEHIIKNESSYKPISEYITNNPQQWEKDKFYVWAGFTPPIHWNHIARTSGQCRARFTRAPIERPT
jgi:hypothetical protein